jgi:hypothetical protein
MILPYWATWGGYIFSTPLSFHHLEGEPRLQGVARTPGQSGRVLSTSLSPLLVPAWGPHPGPPFLDWIQLIRLLLHSVLDSSYSFSRLGKILWRTFNES